MEKTKTKIILLGFDGKLLKNVTDRISSSRPVEALYFTDLQDFLEACLDEKPDLIGLSVSYPHPKASRFPKVFRKVLNTPVITFGENQDIRTRKALSTSKADLRIQGVITAHNLWLKIVNFQKRQEGQANEIGNDQSSSLSIGKNTVFLKSGPDEKNQLNKSSVLSQLLSQLDDSAGTEKPSNMSMIESSESGCDPLKKSDLGESRETVAGQKGPPFSHVSGTDDKQQSSDGSTSDTQAQVRLLGDSSQEDKSTRIGQQSLSFSIQTGQDPSSQQSAQNSPIRCSEQSKQGQVGPAAGKAGEHRAEQSKTQRKDQGVSDQEKRDSASPQKNLNAQKKKKKITPFGEFGKIQLADAKDIQDEEAKKSKEKRKREKQKQMDVLELASGLALEEKFKALKKAQFQNLSINSTWILTVEMGSIKGYMMIAGPNADTWSQEQLKGFKKSLFENLKSQGSFAELSEPFALSFPVESYVETVDEFSEFNICHESSDGEKLNAAFVKREVISPSISESDKQDMYFIDIKVIPPQTPVNFDAYLYLPKNKRFVRYLKPGRSLILKQAKRHTQDEGQSKLYLPKNQKWLFEQFFIKNSLHWEFEINKKSGAA